MQNASTVTAQSVWQLADTMSSQPLGEGEGAVIVDVRTGQIYTSNDTTADFLAALDGERPFSSVVDRLHATYDVDAAELAADLAELAEALAAEGIIRKVA